MPCAPAVVSLKVHIKQGTWLEELRRMNEPFGSSPQREAEGSGVIIDPAGTIATNVLAYERGASIFRVHDVPEAVDSLEVAAATVAQWTTSPSA